MENNKKILVVDDEIKIAEVIKAYLEREGYVVCTAYNGCDAIRLFKESHPSLIILDLMLPDISGEEICRLIRVNSNVPIIMLTAKVQEEDILNGFGLGSDDYVTKPFSPKQLVARVNAVIKRAEGSSLVVNQDIISVNDGDLIIDIVKHEVRKKGEVIYLTPTEFKLLLVFVKNQNRAFTRAELIDKSMNEYLDVYDRVIDSHIKNLRQKIEDNSKEPRYILTVHGIGYKFGGE
ncbi:DNA-binding response regulator [Clostridium polyendosporum]|uniref:Stage 0 sporulation protein A homolog n=1 Tax=Clostridium polyendosporum TaxID=69208 RepID=A0A919RYS7_9CLOT|nr:response regulator transcription factor [Clostridium polyendosporum]GIM28048.1 DNA-binding response regulator [Clostridium polyendosporum]